ncbi:23S rRNA (Uracil-5-) -methyltransferase RumA [Roseibacterium elongatum DSM 19469]|uniref:23S rRNA (Uracil-5-)-methyltransferase RumA n=1 Tax=Roseicyclus elongatus DSM 19469 TaxID=1294273 RepID=W8RR85_9RHOB|nr:class I SAM-dependent RNA methyltransferase [Roseibacterium elongatum]AHM03593.1 23S rRNA (Uracil-5-) -methyltransferase RumA [Roseibacterium elongatum DSM 19469]
MTPEVLIERLGHHGDGIGAGPDGPVFVPLTLPGDQVTGEVEGDRMVAPKVQSPSLHRVRPPCAHFRQCGGCSLQHASDAFVAAWKAEVIATALDAHGLSAPIRPTTTSPPRSRRRATLAGTRTKKGALVGFHARRSDVIVPITDCHVLTPALMACVPVLGEITRLGASRSATLSFALTESGAGIDLAVTGGKPLDGPLRAALPQYARHFTRLTWGDEPVFLDAAPRQHFGPAAVIPPPGAFLQATQAGEAALLTAVQEATQGAAAVADLFAGCGTFALPLAQTAPVHAVEGDAALLNALGAGARHAQGLRPITTEARDLFRRPLLAEEVQRFDAVVIDPPRAGAEAQMRELAMAQVPRIAMVSCNPVTFARDAAILTAAGYVIEWVQPVDQFRWSAHVELAAALRLAHIPA